MFSALITLLSTPNGLRTVLRAMVFSISCVPLFQVLFHVLSHVFLSLSSMFVPRSFFPLFLSTLFHYYPHLPTSSHIFSLSPTPSHSLPLPPTCRLAIVPPMPTNICNTLSQTWRRSQFAASVPVLVLRTPYVLDRVPDWMPSFAFQAAWSVLVVVVVSHFSVCLRPDASCLCLYSVGELASCPVH